MIKKVCAVTLALATLASLAEAGERFSAQVVEIVDGDTFAVEWGGQRIQVALKDVDAPALCQPYGRESAEVLARLVGGQTVRIEKDSIDQRGKVLARVKTTSHPSVAVALVELGAAWVVRTAGSDQQLLQAEARAKSSRVGVWAASNPQAPWEWRTTSPPCSTVAHRSPETSSKQAKSVSKDSDRRTPSAIELLEPLAQRSAAESKVGRPSAFEQGRPGLTIIWDSSRRPRQSSPDCYVGSRGGTYTVDKDGRRNYEGC